MKQVNKSVIAKKENDREPSWCIFCDARDRCDPCDANDWGKEDCYNCDFGSECTNIG